MVLVAQFDRMLDRQIRSLIEYEWIHRKVSNFGIQGKLISAFCGGKLFVAVKVWYPMKEKVGSEFYMYRKNMLTYMTHMRFLLSLIVSAWVLCGEGFGGSLAA